MEVLEARPEVAQVIAEVCRDHHITDYAVTKVELNAKGEGYLGQIFMATVVEARTGRALHVLVKAAFAEARIRATAPIRLSFENEAHFYSAVLPALEAFARAPLALTARCHRVSLARGRELLALENLRARGFETVAKSAVLDDAHVRVVFAAYGRLHAASMAMRARERARFDALAAACRDLYEAFLTIDFFRSYMNDLFEDIGAELVPGVDDAVIARFEAGYLNDQVLDRFKEAVLKDVEHPAILHGDCWSNNMMFKYEEKGGKRVPVDIRLIDFQIIKLGSPVCDLSYCFYSGVSQTELNNFDEYLHIYHDSFSKFARELGSDPNELYPFEAIISDWKKYSKFGMIMGLNVLKMKLTEKSDIMDLTDFDFDDPKMAETYKNIKFDKETFATRAKAVLHHMMQIGAL